MIVGLIKAQSLKHLSQTQHEASWNFYSGAWKSFLSSLKVYSIGTDLLDW